METMIESIMGCATNNGERLILRIVKNGLRQIELATRRNNTVVVLATGKPNILQKIEEFANSINSTDLHSLRWHTLATYVTA